MRLPSDSKLTNRRLFVVGLLWVPVGVLLLVVGYWPPVSPTDLETTSGVVLEARVERPRRGTPFLDLRLAGERSSERFTIDYTCACREALDRVRPDDRVSLASVASDLHDYRWHVWEMRVEGEVVASYDELLAAHVARFSLPDSVSFAPSK